MPALRGFPGLRAGVALVLLVLVLPLRALAGPGDDMVDRLGEALRLQDLAVLMRDEGLDDARDLLPADATGQVSPVAMAQLEEVFDPGLIRAELTGAFGALSAGDLGAAVAFFDSPAGRALVELELVARAAISDPDIEAIARGEWAARRDESGEPIASLRRFAEVNDLVERNTTSTMTARFQFLRGLAAGAGQPADDGEILSRVWAQEGAIRADTEGWLMGYLLLAYGPADPADLDAYVAFSETPAGQAVNAALFEGFEVTYGRISHGLGLVAGRATQAQDL
ncbi:hypothetical protein [Marinibacterium sp. SX1]|uniref:hypothetical protein n=1 Tax=Marinibacterium sp. SX1 TaxID=3388424 RepID=UPI003D16E239